MRGVSEDGEELSGHVGKLQGAFDRLGISIQIVKDTGEMESTYNILSAVADKWDDLSDAERQSLGELAAGKNRITDFNALMSNFNTAITATETAINSVGSASQENEKYLNSIEGRVNQFTSAWQKLSKNLISSDLIKNIVKLGTSILNFVNSDLGQFLIKMTALYAETMLLKKGLSTFLPDSVKKQVTEYITSIMTAKTATEVLKSSASGLGSAAKAGIGNLISSIAAMVKSFDVAKAGALALKATLTTLVPMAAVYAIDFLASKLLSLGDAEEELDEEFEDEIQPTKYETLRDAFKETEDEAGDLKSKIEDINSKIQELESKDQLTITNQKDLANLKEENKLLQSQLTLLEQRQELEKEALREETLKVYSEGTREGSDARYKATGELDLIGTSSYRDEILKNTNAMEIYRAEIQKLIDENEKLDASNKEDAKQIEKNGRKIESLTEHYNELKTINIDLSNQFIEWANILEGGGEEAETVRTELLGLVDWTLTYNELTGEAAETTLNYNQVLEESGNVINTVSSTLEDFNEQVDNIQSAYQTMAGAVEEYNDTGYISLDTLQSLLDLNPAYLASLEMVNGQLVLNEQSMADQIEALKVLKIEELQTAAANDIQNLALGNTAELSDIAKTAIAQFGDSAANSATDIDTATGAVLKLTAGLIAYKEAAGDKTDVIDFEQKAQAIIDSYTKIGNTIAGMPVSSSPSYKYSKSGKGSSSSKTTKDTWKDAFDNAYDMLKHNLAMDYITEQEYTDQLENLYQYYFAGREKYAKEYQKYEEEVYKNRKGFAEDAAKAEEKAAKEAESVWEDEFQKKYEQLKHQLTMEQITQEQYTDRLEVLYKQYYSDLTKYLDKYQKYEEEVYKNRQEILEDYIKSQQDALEKLRKSTEEKYGSAIKVATDAIQDEINRLKEQKEALSDANDEQERAIKLAELEEALQRAKTQRTVRVYDADLGFIYVADEKAIEEAQKALDEYKRDMAMEEAESAFDAQIESLEALKEQWQSITNNYENAQTKLLVNEEYGANFEAAVLSGRLDYVKRFASEYNAAMNSLSAGERNLVAYAASKGIDISGKYANGTTSAAGGFSLVGENGAELRVLNSGDGIIPANMTRNLMDWGSINPRDYMNGYYGQNIQSVNKNLNNNSTVYNFSNLKIESNANSVDALIKDIELKVKNR